MAGSGEIDVVIIGGGHNGLTCAAYLAAAGLAVTVVEKNDVVGGAALTEEFHPGFRNSVASYTVSLLNPRIIADLDLARHGLEIIERPAGNFWPVEDARYRLMRGDIAERQAAIAQFSARDAERFPAYDAMLERAAGVLRDLVLTTPPNAGGGIAELIKAGAASRHVARLPLEEKRVLLDLFTRSASDFLDGWFESDVVKASFAFDGIVGNYAAPSTPGTAYVLLHHCFGEVNGRRGAWGHAIGGMGSITQAMASAAKARAVASNVPPKLLFRDLVPEAAVAPETRALFTGMKTGSGTFRMNVALSELPDFICRPGKRGQDHHGAGIIIGPTLQYLERAYLDARIGGWSREPVVEMLIPSTLDSTLAPPGRHVASLFVQHVAPHLPDGRSWEDAGEKERFADLVIDTVSAHAPNFRRAVIARQVLSPLDLEQRFGLIDGDIFHGQLSLDQLFSLRPVMGFADYRLPVKGLYLCGSGAHPGGGVTGVPGHNAAREIVRDLKRQLWSLGGL
jgi:phytoene dehydrogenase-like protein